MQGGTVRYDDTVLRKLGALFKSSSAVVRVGILNGPKMARKNQTSGKGGPATNAQIGAIQEFGSFTRGIPPRSFLHMPLKSDKVRKRVAADAREALEHAARGGGDTAKRFFGNIGAGLVAVVQASFEQSGPGWKPLKPSTIQRRRTRKVAPRRGTKPLIDTGELRHSISFRVIK